MKTKTKLIATISMFCLTFAMILVGVWAVSSANIEIGGKITFQATHVNAKVTGSISGGSLEENYVPTTLEYTATTSPTTTALNTWKKDLSFTETNTTITMTINVENRSTERCLYVSIADTVGDVANLTKTTKQGDTVLTNGQDVEVSPETTETFTITMSLDSVDVSVDSTWNYLVNLTDATEQHTISTKYSIEDGEVYKTTYCTDCETEGTKTKMSENSYVIATPSTAQAILDSDINGKTVVFTSDTDGTSVYSDILELRPSKATATVYTKGTMELVEGDLDSSTVYYYQRDFSNITFAGTEGVTFTNLFLFEGMQVGKDYDQSPIADRYDAVKEKTITTVEGYHSILNMNNITFNGMNFTGRRGRIFSHIVHKGTEPQTISGITVENCSFITDTPGIDDNGNRPQWDAAVYILPGTSMTVENFKFTNNTVDGHYQGIHTAHVTNTIFANNTIKNTTHNALALQSYTDDPIAFFSGNVEISNNYIENTSDRAIRFGATQGADIVIENNTFVHAVDADKELLKTQASTNLNYDFKYNTYNGIDLENQSGTTTQLIITLPDSESEMELTLSEDGTYYYVEMGEYNGTPVRWRYVSADGETKYDISTGAPTLKLGDKGWFIQETVTVSRKWGDDVGPNQEIIDYLNSVETNGYLNTLQISADNNILSRIYARHGSNYERISVVSFYNSDFDAEVYYDPSLVSSAKLWIPHLHEVYTMLGGGTITGKYLPDSSAWDTVVKNNLAWDTSYWTATDDDLIDNFVIATNGEYSYGVVEDSSEYKTTSALRPMFILEF